MPEKGKTICLDFDGVLAEYHGWEGPHHHGLPLPSAREFLERLRDAGVTVVVLTSREGSEEIKAWFKPHNLPMPSKVTNKKVPANAYVDDRAVHFDGDFSHLLKDLKKFKPHWKDQRPFEDL